MAASTNSYESIATVTIGSGGVSNIEFSSIPATYTHLQIRLIAEGADVSGPGPMSLDVVVNSDTGANYSRHRLYGDGSSAAADAGTSQADMFGGLVNYSASVNNIFGAAVIDILDYANTNKYTTTRSLSGVDKNGAGGFLQFMSGLWMNTAAVTSITILPNSDNFGEYSSFALYGIKGS